MVKTICILGGGMIGQQWAMLFTAYKYDVVIFELFEKQIEICKSAIRNNLQQYIEKNISRSDEHWEIQFKRITITSNYRDLSKDSEFVIECVNENIEMKRKVFQEMDSYFGKDTIRMSSSSYLPISNFTEELINKSKCIIAHPVAPPYFLRLVEIVPAPYTDASTIAKTKELMDDIGQAPVVFKKETYGFALNRIQSAVYNSVFKLVSDGIVDARDVDKLLTEGLGPRYAFYGPLTVAGLNGPGIETYFKKYLSSIDTVNNDQNYKPQHDENVIRRIVEDLDALNDLDNLKVLEKDRSYNIGQILKIKTKKEN